MSLVTDADVVGAVHQRQRIGATSRRTSARPADRCWTTSVGHARVVPDAYQMV
ncbi:hypothetical protein OVY01_07460 [Robbsia sp. Bb-Pol-6]|uniref:Uncharacterized protein n=1 Tax=Robbsia betulipollinis TaxID=2981849 RepID=A0ABT3ZKL0_9BURK|nr:hypothetical protein [Robbsia betulipollinis]MCY0387073.1 hypothetical protein [Robbsia betulipollinis]